MKRYLNWIVVCCMALIMVGCTPKVIEPEIKKDPFVLGTTPIKGFEIQDIYAAYFTANDPLAEEILSTKSWIKTNQQVNGQIVLTLTDNLEYVYRFTPVSGRYLVIIKSPYYDEDHRYLVSDAVYRQIKEFLYEKYVPDLPAIYPFVKAMLGIDETTMFEVDLTAIRNYLRPVIFSPQTEIKDLSRYQAKFSLIDDHGNRYRFYDQAETVVVNSVESQTEKQYNVNFGTISDVWKSIKEAYPEALITDQLKPVLFTALYMEGLSTYSASQLISISQITSDMINQRLNLRTAYKADVIPNADSNCAYVFKDNTGLFYVVCYSPYVVGIGKDPKGALTYYSLGDVYSGDLGGFLYRLPLAAPAGSRLDGFTFTKANVIMHCDCDRHVDLTSAQNQFLINLMDLQNHSSVTYDNSAFVSEEYNADDLFALTTSSGQGIRFYIDNKKRTVLFTIDYNGYEKMGNTYYLVDSTGYNKILEAHFTIAGLIDTVKADASPTYDAFFIGDQQAYTTLPDVPMTVLTNEQITTIDALLQRSSWQNIALYDNAIDLKSQFVLRKDSTSYYVFSQLGSISVVTLRSTNQEEKVYLIPNKALNDVLNTLKTIK